MTYASLKSAAEDKNNIDIAKSVPTFGVNPKSIAVIPGFNGRPISRAHVEVLKAAWRAGKVSNPPYNPLPELTLRMVGGKQTLLDGEHRLTAYLELIAEGEPIERVPAKEFKGTDKQATLYMLGANSGMGWTQPQLGIKYAELVNMFGMTYAEVAAERGMSTQHVKDCIRLTEQPEEIKDAINTGAISPSLALKLVKSEGAEKAAETIKQAAAAVAAPKPGIKAPKGGGITQKVIDRVARAGAEEGAERNKMIKDGLSAMHESPSFDRVVKDAIRTVMRAIGGRMPSDVVRAPSIDHVGEYLREQALNCNDMVQHAAKLLIKARNKEFIPANSSPGAKWYGHVTWLQDLAGDSTKHPVRGAAARWFLAVLDLTRDGQQREVAPPPSLLGLAEAIQAEIDSGGAVNAESMCPEHAALVAYLRTGVKP